MPNYVTTRIEVSQDFSFNTVFPMGLYFEELIPQPPELMSGGILSSTKQLAEEIIHRVEEVSVQPAVNASHMNLAKIKIALDLLARGLSTDYLKDTNEDRVGEQTKNLVDMILSFYFTGYYTWFEWNKKNWGTKWDACDVDMTEKILTFDTAWTHPFPVIKALSLKHPTILFKVLYADENIGENCGSYTILNNKKDNIQIVDHVVFAQDLLGDTE